MITLEEGVSLVWTAFEEMLGGEIFVKKIPSMNIMDIAEALDPGSKREFVGIRPGEKLHEQMIGQEDSLSTYDYGDHYRIIPAINEWSKSKSMIGKGIKVDEEFSYESDTNAMWMPTSGLVKWITENQAKIGAI
jgi:FlaA1/EpsC-like NDP-sugar epimerase